jgi:hypothetical protein
MPGVLTELGWLFDPVELIVQILYGALTAVLLIFGTDLAGRYISADKRTRMDAAYLFFFIMSTAMIGYGLYMITALVNYFYNRVDWIVSFQKFVVILILGPFCMVSERIMSKKKRKVSISSILTVVTTIYLAALVFMEYFDDDNLELATTYYIPAFVVFAFFAIFGMIGFVVVLFVKLSPQKEIKKRLLLGMLAGAVALVGEAVQVMGRSPPTMLYVYGTLMEIAGFLIMRYFFLSVPSYGELEWKNGMVEMHVIMAETGLSLYYHVFEKINPASLKGDVEIKMTIEESARPDTDLIGGGMIGISTMLKEIAGTKGKLESIKIGEKQLVFKTGEHLMVLLLADKYLGVYDSILLELVRELEAANPGLASFTGDTSKLTIKPIVEKTFNIKA